MGRPLTTPHQRTLGVAIEEYSPGSLPKVLGYGLGAASSATWGDKRTFVTHGRERVSTLLALPVWEKKTPSF